MPVNLYFLASPLQCLAAKRITKSFEEDSVNIALPYKPGARDALDPEDWDRFAYVPWPRFEPMPGMFGRLRRSLDNLRRVRHLIPVTHEIRIHTAVLDTEAINYYVNDLRRSFPNSRVVVRILPDGLISTRRYPLSSIKRAGQWLKKLRRLVTPRLNYYCYGGDRCGTDAEVVDRIYVLQNFPHEYSLSKVVELPALIEPDLEAAYRRSSQARALIIGQPLVGAGLLKREHLFNLTHEINEWLLAEGAQTVYYKPHPKDPNCELSLEEHCLVTTNEALESWLVRESFDWIVGARSTALLMARQLCSPQCRIRAFGFDRLIFKSEDERLSMSRTFREAGVVIHGEEE